MKIKISRRSAIRKSISFLTIGVCVFAFGCKDAGTKIWSADSPSPDRNWVASANTKQWSGPGTAYVATSVYLKPPDGSKPAVEILEFASDSALPSGITNVEMNWLTPSHLEITYMGHATLNFQVVKFAGIDISVRDISTEAIDTPIKK
jgi:hypothetical protein